MMTTKARFYLLSATVGLFCLAANPAGAINQSTPLPESFCKSVHLNAVNQVIDQYKTWATLKKYPENLAENNTAQMFDSTSAFLSNFKTRLADLKDQPLAWDDRTLLLNEKIPQKYLGLWGLHATVEKALLKQNVSQRNSKVLGILAQQDLAEAQGLNWTEYRKEMNSLFGKDTIPKTQDLNLHQAFDSILSTLKMSYQYQVPYLAGYARNNAHQIYIDDGVLPSYMTPDGKIDVSLDLSMHEFVEKSLIDWTQLDHKQYLRTHQIAQRIEKAMVEFYGFSWSYYQGKIMQAEIIRADDAGRSDKTLTHVPPDLDLTPYIDYEETEMIARMKKAGLE